MILFIYSRKLYVLAIDFLKLRLYMPILLKTSNKRLHEARTVKHVLWAHYKSC